VRLEIYFHDSIIPSGSDKDEHNFLFFFNFAILSDETGKYDNGIWFFGQGALIGR
jgi:hypothetical protein